MQIMPYAEYKQFVDKGLAVWSERKKVSKREVQFRLRALKSVETLGYTSDVILEYRSLSRQGFIAKNCLYSFTQIRNVEIAVYGKERDDLKKRFVRRKSDNKLMQLTLFEEK